MTQNERCILDDVHNYLGRFIIYPTDSARIAHTLWIAHSYLLEAFDTTPRLAVVSAEKRSGKTRLLDITQTLVRNPMSFVSPTASALYTAIDFSKETPTILLDEVDRLFERRSENNADLIAIIDAGFQRGKRVPRTRFHKKGDRELGLFEVFGPLVMAGINKQMPDTITDRSITLPMKRRSGTELLEPYRVRDQAVKASELKDRLVAWAKENMERAKEMRPDLPKGIEDRQADIWEPLLICAACAACGALTGVWVGRAEKAALAFLNEGRDIEPATGTLLLRDIREIYNTTDPDISVIEDKITTEDLLKALHRISESPWAFYSYGRSLDARGLAKLLKVYGIHPTKFRKGDDTPRGYVFGEFFDAWRRYLPPVDTLPPLQKAAQAERTTQPSQK